MDKREDILRNKLLLNFSFFAAPIGMTAILGTFTYPRAVRIARSKRLLGLRNFYAIHFAIAPFLALIHLNFFALVQSYFKLKIHEVDFIDQTNLDKLKRKQIRIV